MRIAVVTGVSRGLGESIAKLFLESGIHVVGLSRNNNEALEKYATDHGAMYHFYPCNLNNVSNIETVLHKIFTEFGQQELSTVYLVNNAAMVEPINQASQLNNTDVEQHIQVNMVAPIIMTNQFLTKANEMKFQLISVSITSGAAERAIYGWSAYCSTKAAINMYTKTVALEQQELKTGNKVIAFSPGIMDTVMQEKIRSSTNEEFIEIETFKNYKQQNMLKSPEEVAGVLVDILMDTGNIQNGEIYNVRDYI